MNFVKITNADLEILRGKTSNPEVIKLIKEIDKEKYWVSKIKEFGVDVRVWPVVASIFEQRKVSCYYGQAGPTTQDIMGHQNQPIKQGRGKKPTPNDSGICVNGIKFTYPGWKEATPHVQKALDELDFAYEAQSKMVNLKCSKGEFYLEEIYEEEGKEYRELDFKHSNSGCAGTCHKYINGKNIINFRKLQKRVELVNIEGYKTCSNCGKPKRQEGVLIVTG